MAMRIHSGIPVWALALAVAVAACGGGGGDTEAPAAGPTPNATADGPGTITGKIAFDGDAPPRQVVRMGSDPNCRSDGEPALSETIIVSDDKGLQNAFVYVKDGLGDRVYATPTTPIVLDQEGCRYEPHVFGVQVGQPVEIRNSDPTLHNVHAIPKTNAEFNFGQQDNNVPPTIKAFDKPEIGVSFRCDVHGWMRAYANVVTHPFFSVSKQDGSFEIKGLPPGTYTVEAWHERLGLQTQTITIEDANPAATADFTFKQST